MNLEKNKNLLEDEVSLKNSQIIDYIKTSSLSYINQAFLDKKLPKKISNQLYSKARNSSLLDFSSQPYQNSISYLQKGKCNLSNLPETSPSFVNLSVTSFKQELQNKFKRTYFKDLVPTLYSVNEWKILIKTLTN